MFTYTRYLILTVLVIFFAVLDRQKVSGTSENQENEAKATEGVSSAFKNVVMGAQNSSVIVPEVSRRKSEKCVEGGGRCNVACDCCQHGTDAYECTLNEYKGIKYCTSAHLPPLLCPYAPRPCKPNDDPCSEDCDCCQTDQNGEPHRVTCYIEKDAKVGYCLPQPYVVIDCFPPPPPPSITPPPPKYRNWT